jgi:hypothetical protein
METTMRKLLTLWIALAAIELVNVSLVTVSAGEFVTVIVPVREEVVDEE